jgi:Trk-type K+ transport system membrane component
MIKPLPEAASRLSKFLDPLLLVASALAVVSLVADYGFTISETMRERIKIFDFWILSPFIIQWGVRFALAENRKAWVRRNAFFTGLVGAIVILVILATGLIPTAWVGGMLGLEGDAAVEKLYLGLGQLLLIIGVIVYFAGKTDQFVKLRIQPTRIAVGSFALMILLGWGALLLPKATYHGIDPIDALFMSTSAVCITGLVTVDVVETFTPLGQGILLVLIQAGGLGIMTLTMGVFMLFGGIMGFRERIFLQDFLQSDGVQKITNVLINITLFTLIVEAIGAGFLFWFWSELIPHPGERLWLSVFHSVSAFCNAGFSNAPGGLGGDVFGSNGPGLLLIMGVAFIGAAGYPVWSDLLRMDGKRGRRGWRMHTRLVLRLHIWLWLGAAGILLALEWNNGFAVYDFGQKIVHSLFMGLMPRTSGFNSMDVNSLGAIAIGMMVVLMTMGGAPAGTAGGVKITTIAVVFAYLKATIRGSGRPTLLQREIDADHCQRAMSILLLYGMGAVAGTTAILALEGLDPGPVAFEVVSAMSTCGLSMGITPELSPPSKTIVVLLMFAGRLGILTVLWSFFYRGKPVEHGLPRENVMLY